jgi:hypothetical protein
MEQSDLLRKLATSLEKLGIEYVVVGSTASIAYGEPRFTNDIDVVVNLSLKHVAPLCAEFPGPEFYVSQPAVQSAVSKQFQFNILHPSSGYKIDCIVAGADEFARSELDRGVEIYREDGAYKVRFATPEDVIIKKLEYFKLGESEKHVRDILGILRAQGDRIDRDYIDGWSRRKGLTDIWDAILARLAAR